MKNASIPLSELPSYTRHDLAPISNKYAVLIPVLNEGERIRSQLAKMKDLKLPADIFIVDGGSSDNALDLDFLKAQGVRVLCIKTGPGKLSAQLRIGLAEIMKDGYEGVVLIDGNNKDNPAAIPTFISALDSGVDHVQGSRFVAGGIHVNTPADRLWAIKLIHAPLISLAARARYTDTTNGFRAYSRRFLLDPKVQPFRGVFNQYELHYYLAIRAARLGYKVTEVPVERSYPDSGEVPTKIKGARGNMLIMKTLVDACLGKFNP